jgi:phosphohistidine phosphatase
MTKKLLLIRHAKSDWSTPNCSDFDRPLNKRGNENALMMAKRLKNNGILLQKIVSSPALRAISTANIIATEIGISKNKIELNKFIYEASCNTLLKIVNELDQKTDFVTLIGHNNAITDLAVYLTDADIFNIPTCGMVMITFPFKDWKMISKNTGEVVFYDYPKKQS